MGKKEKLIPYDIDLSNELKFKNYSQWRKNHTVYLEILNKNRLQDRKEMVNIKNKIYLAKLSPERREEIKKMKLASQRKIRRKFMSENVSKCDK